MISTTNNMRVQKRARRGFENVKFDKITARIQHLCNGLKVDPILVALSTIKNLYDGISTEELDRISAQIADSMSTTHPDYALLAGRILASNLHKTTPKTFSECMKILQDKTEVLHTFYYDFICANAAILDNMIIDSNDTLFDYIGYVTLERSYLHKVAEPVFNADGEQIYVDANDKIVTAHTDQARPKIVERVMDRPQYMYMRVAIAVNLPLAKMKESSDMRILFDNIKHCYKLLSQMYFTHATPTLFNACTIRQNLLSCFAADTEVCTLSGVKKIQDVQIGDEVVTHLGNIKRVEQVHTNLLGDRKLMELTVQKTHPIKVTDNHRVWGLQVRESKPGWIKVSDLTDRSYVCIPNTDQYKSEHIIIDLADYIDVLTRSESDSIKYELITNDTTVQLITHFILGKTATTFNSRKESQEINRFWTFDEDFCKFVGIFYGDGHIANSKSRTNGIKSPYGIGLTLNPINNDDLSKFITTIGEKVFGITVCTHQMKGQNTFQILFNNKVIGIMFKYLFGEKYNGKKLWVSFLQMNHSHIYALIAGLISTDECVNKAGNIMLEMSNIPFMKSVYHLSRNHGIDVSFKVRTHKDNQDTGRISFPYIKEILSNVNKTYTDGRIVQFINKQEGPGKKNKNQTSAIIKDNKRFLRVKSIKSLDERPEFVYTLGIADDHSYPVEGLMVENCFLIGTDDSIEEIQRTIKNSGLISKMAGGIGTHLSNIRCAGRPIKSTGGKSCGLVRQLKIYDATMVCFDQGGKRKGANAMYIEPHHGDIIPFLKLKLNQGSDDERARDLFYALWISDLFVETASNKEKWSLFSEDNARGLSEVFDGMRVCSKCDYCANKGYAKYMPIIRGENMRKDITIDGDSMQPTSEQLSCNHEYIYRDCYTELYRHYEKQGIAVAKIDSDEVLNAMFEAMRESGTPYVCFKDNANRMTNQAGLGTIKSSNLCSEVMQWSSADSYACCTLASINLKAFLVADQAASSTNGLVIDHEKLHAVVMNITRNLDLIININKYPVEECISNAQQWRPIGIGVQGLANVFALMRIPFLSQTAAKIDLEIFETIYHAALTQSNLRAIELGPFRGFEYSPSARGELAPDLWKRNQDRLNSPLKNTSLYSGRYDWDILRANIIKSGLRNSLHIAPMPTVSTSQLLGNNESFEPFSSNLFRKTILAAKVTVVNTIMVQHLIDLGIWNEDIKMRIMNAHGSVQHIEEIPKNVRDVYLTVYEMSQKEIMNRASIRQAFVDQSQSLNIHLRDNSNPTLRGVFFHGHKIGLKTGSYYIRTLIDSSAMKTNISASKQIKNNTQLVIQQSEDLPDTTIACGESCTS